MVASRALLAAKNGDLATLKELEAENNLSDNIVDENGATCLHYAARNDRSDVLEYLVKFCGFDAGKRSHIGSTAAHDAAATGNLKALSWILLNTECKADDQDGSGSTLLHLSSLYGHTYVLRWLIEKTNCDILKKASSGAIPLHFSIVGGDIRAVKLLVDEAPRSVNMQMQNGATAAYLSAQEGRLEILKFLVLEAKASVKMNAYDGMSCLHAAAQMGNLNVVKWLISEQGANANIQDFDGATPLHYAASRGHREIVEWMLQNGGAKIALDNIGGSPLHNAAELGQIECVRALLSNGCNPDIPDNSGLTAHELAEKCYEDDIASTIKRRQGDEDSDSDEHTYLNTPTVNGAAQVLQYDYPPPSGNGLTRHHTSPGDGHSEHSNRNSYTERQSEHSNRNSFTEIGTISREHSYQNIPSSEPQEEKPTPCPLPYQQSKETGECEFIEGKRKSWKPVSGQASANWETLQEFQQTTTKAHIIQQPTPSTPPQFLPPPPPPAPPHPTSLSSPRLRQSISNSSELSSSVSTLSSVSHTGDIAGDEDEYYEPVRGSGFNIERLRQRSPTPPASRRKSPHTENHRGDYQASVNSAEKQRRHHHHHHHHNNNNNVYINLNNNEDYTTHSPPYKSVISIRQELESQHKAWEGKPIPERLIVQAPRSTQHTPPGFSPPLTPPLPPPPPALLAATPPLSSSPPNLPPPPPPPPVPPVAVKPRQQKMNGEASSNNEVVSGPPTLNGILEAQAALRPASLNGDLNGRGSNHKTPSPSGSGQDQLIAELRSIGGTASLKKTNRGSRTGSVTYSYTPGVGLQPMAPADKPQNGLESESNGQTEREKEVDELNERFHFKKFLDKVGDSSIPDWKRQLLARQMADKAKKDFEEKKKIDDYEARFKGMPSWKRALIEKKETDGSEGE